MEKSHGPHRNPKLLESDSNYANYCPLDLCTAIREKYGDLVIIKSWPALTQRIHESNLCGVGEQKNRSSTKCHGCGSEYHLKFNFPKSSPSYQHEGRGADKTQET